MDESRDTDSWWTAIDTAPIPPDMNGYSYWPSPLVKMEHGIDPNQGVGCVPNDPRLPALGDGEFLLRNGSGSREWRCRHTR